MMKWVALILIPAAIACEDSGAQLGTPLTSAIVTPGPACGPEPTVTVTAAATPAPTVTVRVTVTPTPSPSPSPVPIEATLKYSYTAGIGGCGANEVRQCTASKQFAASRLSQLSVDYAGCTITQPTANHYTIDCTEACTNFLYPCSGAGYVTIYNCPAVHSAQGLECQWDET